MTCARGPETANFFYLALWPDQLRQQQQNKYLVMKLFFRLPEQLCIPEGFTDPCNSYVTVNTHRRMALQEMPDKRIRALRTIIDERPSAVLPTVDGGGSSTSVYEFFLYFGII